MIRNFVEKVHRFFSHLVDRIAESDEALLRAGVPIDWTPDVTAVM